MLQIQALVIVAILLSYTLTAHLIQRYKIRFLHESVVAIFLGIVTASILKYGFGDAVEFDSEFFFNFLLPPIIFAAGYNLHRAHFFDNFWLISYHGIVCTVITFIILTAFAILFNEWVLAPDQLGEDELMLLAATLCATDTVAALTLVKESEYPILNSVLFGEGIFNDAVSILIFRSVKNYMKTGNTFSQISFAISIQIFVDFIYLLFVSLFVGIIVGAISSLLFKYCDSLNKHPVKETAIILLVGYASYLISESLHLSGILSLFCCGIIMAVYTYPNISSSAQQGTSLAFDTIGYLVEGFVFAYLGITTLQNPASNIPWLFSILMMLAMAFARFFTVFLLPCIYFLMKRKFSLNVRELQVVWYAGLIRGVIAFALSTTITTPNRQRIEGCVLFIVLLTTCVGSILLESFARCIGLKVPDESLMMQFQEFMSSKSELTQYHSIGNGPANAQKVELPEATGWRKIEEKIVRPIFSKKGSSTEPAEISMYTIERQEL